MSANQQPTRAEVIRTVAARIAKYGKRGINEQESKASLIDPLLQALGWDTHDRDVVRREFRPKGADDPVDYALQIDHRPRVLVEAKALGEPLDDRRFIKQTLGYAVMAGVAWCALTDGDRWLLFNATAAVDADAKLFWQVRISAPTDNHTALGFLARDIVACSALDTAWTDHAADRQIKAAMERLVAGPDKGLIGLLLKECPSVPLAGVLASLKRLGVRVDAPLPDPARVGSAPAGPPAKKGPRRSLQELFAAGVLRSPLRLVKVYNGRTIEAVAHADGSVETGGTRFPAVSSAAKAAVRAAGTPSRKSADGWDFWEVAEGPHAGKKIGDVRERG